MIKFKLYLYIESGVIKMIIKALAENHAISEEYKTQHGLSLYIATEKHKILFDLGQNHLFLENAEKMDVNITDIDLVVISHGHYDHGGGLKTFLKENNQAKIYLHQKAFDKHFAKRPNGETADIGLDEVFKNQERIILTGDYQLIDDGLELFSNIKGKELCSTANKVLLMQEGAELAEDTFAHEQNLIITENGKTLLIAGCAHNGIVNIVKQGAAMIGKNFDYVIGGFHLFNPGTRESEAPELIKAIGEYLQSTGSVYYTCHCTGLEAYAELKDIMGKKINYLATGETIQFKQ